MFYYDIGEAWSPGVSNLTQVLVSILFLVFVEEPYFNEPGYVPNETNAATSKRYNHDIVCRMLQWAIEDFFFSTNDYVPVEIKNKIKEKVSGKWVTQTRSVLEKKLMAICESGSYQELLLTRAVSAFQMVNKLITGEEHSLNLPPVIPAPAPTKRLRVLPSSAFLTAGSSAMAVATASGGLAHHLPSAYQPSTQSNGTNSAAAGVGGLGNINQNTGVGSVFGLPASTVQSLQALAAHEDFSTDGFDFDGGENGGEDDDEGGIDYLEDFVGVQEYVSKVVNAAATKSTMKPSGVSTNLPVSSSYGLLPVTDGSAIDDASK